jgi:septum formation protein
MTNQAAFHLILASQSPRRCQLLQEAGFEFSVNAPSEDVERGVATGLEPGELVVEAAFLKAKFVAQQVTEGIILAADTIAHCDSEILGKPTSRQDAKRMLQWMSGKRHEVMTGVCLWHRPSDVYQTHLEITVLRMDEFSPAQLETFLDSGGWQGKAGGFGYQDGLDWVHIESGLASNVVGLPVERLPAWIEKLKRSSSCGDEEN